MAIAPVQAPAAAQANGTNTVSKSFDIAPTVGNVIYVAVWLTPNGTTDINTPTDNQSGNTYTLVSSRGKGGSGRQVALWRCVVSGSSGTFTITVTTTTNCWYSIGIAEFSGIAASPSDQTAGRDNSNTDGTTPQSGSATPTQNGELLLSVFDYRTGSDSTTHVPSSGWSNLSSTPNDNTITAGAFDYRIAPDKVSYTDQPTIGASLLSGATSPAIIVTEKAAVPNTTPAPYIQTTPKIQSGSSGNGSGTFPTTPTAGNLIVVYVWAYKSGGAADLAAGVITDNKGNTYHRAVVVNNANGADNISAAIFYAYNISSSATFTVSLTSSNNAYGMVAVEYASMITTDPLDKVSSNTGNSSAPDSGATAALSVPGELVAACFGTIASGTVSWIDPSGFTNRAKETDNATLQVGQGLDKLVESKSAVQASWSSMAASGVWSAVVATFKLKPYIRLQNAAVKASSSTSVVNITGTPIDGELILAVCQDNENPAFATPTISGFSSIASRTDADWNPLHILGKIASSEGANPSYTSTWAGGAGPLGPCMGIFVITNADSALPTNTATTHDTTSDTSFGIPGITIAAVDSLDFVALTQDGNIGVGAGNYSSWGDSLVEVIEFSDPDYGNYPAFAVAAATRTATGARGSTSVTSGATDKNVAIRVEIKPPSSAPTGTSTASLPRLVAAGSASVTSSSVTGTAAPSLPKLTASGVAQPAGVYFDAGSESHTGTTGSTSQTSFTWNHTPVGVPKGILVFVFTNANADDISTVTYGGVTMSQIAEAAAATAEPGRTTLFYLGSGIPTGTQAVVVNRTNNTDVMYAVAISVVATRDTEAYATTIVTENTVGTLAQQSISDGRSGGSLSTRFAAINTGLAAPPSAGANSTDVHNIDFGARGASVVRETVPGTGARNIGFSSGTSDDRATIYVAVREIATTITGTPVLKHLVASASGSVSAAAPNATGAPNLPHLVASASALHKILISGTPALGHLVASATGVMQPKGAAASNLPHLTASAVALQKIIGSTASALAHLVASASGLMQPKGSAAASLAHLVASASALHKITATSAATLPHLVTSAVGVMHPKGAAATNLPHVTASASALQRIIASGADTLPHLVASASGSMGGAPTASGASTLAHLVASGNAKQAQIGSAASALAHLSASATAVHKILISGNPALPKLGANGSTLQKIIGSAASSVPKLTANASALHKILSTAASTLPYLTSASTATVTSFGFTANGASVLPHLVAALTGKVPYRGTAAVVLGHLVASASATQKQIASGSPRMGHVVAAANGLVIRSATGASSLSHLVTTGSAKQTQISTGAPALPHLVDSASAIIVYQIIGSGAGSLPHLVADGAAHGPLATGTTIIYATLPQTLGRATLAKVYAKATKTTHLGRATRK